MSGILDNKTRVFDTIITFEGRKQLSQGGIDISYVSFTDSTTFYSPDAMSGSSDITNRVYLESCNLPQDQITFQADEMGKILPFSINSANNIVGGQLVSSSIETNVFGGATIISNFITGSELVSLSDDIFASSIGNFKMINVIGSIDSVFNDEEFIASNKNINFTVPTTNIVQQTKDIESMIDILADPKFSNLKNFTFLPPINKVESESVDLSDNNQTMDYQLAEYSPWYGVTSSPPNYYEESKNCSLSEKDGLSSEIYFDPTSRYNNLSIQVFEVSSGIMKKLDIIDFGKFDSSIILKNSNNKKEKPTFAKSNNSPEWTGDSPAKGKKSNPNSIDSKSKSGTNVANIKNSEKVSILGDAESSIKHMFFVGKLVKKESTQTDAFIHLFTIVFG